MPNAPVEPGTSEPKMSTGKALAAFAAMLGIVLAFAFGVAALIKWVV